MALLKKKGAKPVVALDDGHGMQTVGKRTPTLPNGLKSETGSFMHENEFNRAVVRYLATELKNNGFTVVLTAPTDADTSLGARAKTATNAKADLLLSVHANANTGKWGTANGVETLSSPAHKDIALVFQNWLMKGTAQRNRGWKDGAWLGLVKSTKVPVVLVEAGFMDNLTEARLLLSDAYRRECAKELAQACCQVFGVTYKSGSSTAPKATTTNAYPYDASKGIGTLKVLVDKLNVREDASFGAKVIDTLKKDQVFYVYETKNGLHRVSEKGWVSAGAAYTKFTPHPSRRRHVVVKGETLWGISQSSKVSVAKIHQLNPKLKEVIEPGDIIYLT